MAEKKPYGGDERRKFKRKQAEFMVTYLVQHPMEVVMRLGDKKMQASMLDLSEEGVAIKVEQDIPPGTELIIGFVLLYSFTAYENIMQDMQIEGVIVNRAAVDDKTFRLGIHFTKIKPVDRKALIDFVAHISKG